MQLRIHIQEKRRGKKLKKRTSRGEKQRSEARWVDGKTQRQNKHNHIAKITQIKHKQDSEQVKDEMKR